MKDSGEQSHYKYIYGPVSSWRLGRSLGIDPISSLQKVCTFDCVYCQAGKTKVFENVRKVYVPTEEMVKELRQLPEISVDYITFAGNGEPTLAQNLGEMIRAVRCVRPEKIAVITNASLIDRKDVQQDLLLADLVEAKLDAFSQDFLEGVNRPAPGIFFEAIVSGLKVFRRIFDKHLTLQVMFVPGNKTEAEKIARLALEIHPDEIEINTPLRACSVQPLRPDELEEVTKIFRKVCGDQIKIRNVYEAKREKSRPFSEPSTERRRGKENL